MTGRPTPTGSRWTTPLLAGLTTVLVSAAPVSAHASNLGGARETVTVPVWLVLLTGGAVIGASFLLVSMVTDRRLIRSVHEWGVERAVTVPHWVSRLGQFGGLLVLLALVVVGLFGPQTATVSLTVLFVWVVWWAGYTMSVYLLGNSWPALNPWRLLADAIPLHLDVSVPTWLGSWPSVLGLFALVWVEVTSPVADSPRFMATVILGYSVVTVAGAVVVGTDRWFAEFDPISRVFRLYGAIGPFQRTDDGLAVGLPGWRLAVDDVLDGWDDVGFVVGLLWLTTFDGFVATPSWRTVVEYVVGLGVPPLAAYLLLVVGGFAIFSSAYWIAVRTARRWAHTALSVSHVGVRFGQALLPIAAGYHLAHYLGYFLRLGPSVVVLATRPFAPPVQLPVLVLPGWFGTLQLAFVLVGHVVAIWIAHAIAFETFTGRLQPIRSQYPFSIVMVAYTMISIAIVYQPSISLPYL
ncbi:MAG: hypothetical protein ABEJ67_02940 [Halanaeroarchaeum sp.]